MDQIEGRLVGVAESWPLQLSVQADDGATWSVSLQPGARVALDGASADAGALRPGLRVAVQGRLAGPQAMVAAVVSATR